MKKIFIIMVTILALGGGGFAVYTTLKSDETQTSQTVNDNTQKPDTSTDEKTAAPAEESEPPGFDFAAPKKSAHYVSNSPEHGAILDKAPDQVSLTFNFDLSTVSTIFVMKDGQEVSTGSAAVSADKLTLSKSLIADAGSGLYTVVYNACWPDGSCHDGQFQFGVRQ